MPVLATMAVIGANLAGSTGASAGSAFHSRVSQATSSVSANQGIWSGYIQNGKAGTFRSITGEWVVPAVTPSSHDADSSTWIGIGGNSSTDTNLLQLGTDQFSVSGQPAYAAWWEIYPATQQNAIQSITIHPGDRIWTSIGEASNGGVWTLALVDMTSDALPFTIALKNFNGKLKSAEWIEERNDKIEALADYGRVSFDFATVNGHNPKLIGANRLDMVVNGAHVSTPSKPDSDGDGFTIAYGATEPSPPASVGDPIPSHTLLSSAANPSPINQLVTYTASVVPVPDGGTVAFIQDGTPITGCGAVSVGAATGEATCSVVYSSSTGTGGHAVAAVFSGDAHYSISVSPSLLQVITSAWNIVPSPTASDMGASLFGVSCPSANFCMAVGNSSDYTQTLIEEWNETTWGIVSSPNVANTDYDSLNAVSCVSASFCMAAGDSSTSTYPNDQVSIEEWSGSSWSDVSSPNVGGGDLLNGLSCVSASFCMAVGWSYASSSSSFQTLIEEWNGTSWSIVNSPDTGGAGYDALSGVSCTSASFCMAAGDSGTPTSGPTLIEEWNGSSWLIVYSPDTSDTDADNLLGVSCASASFCTAVGDWTNTYPGTNSGTMIEAWNGNYWTIVSSPTANDDSAALAGVSCINASFCVAAGTIDGSFSNPGPSLIEQWNGATWATVSSLSTGQLDEDILNGVSCAGASFCTAAGFNYAVGDDTNGTLIEQS